MKRISNKKFRNKLKSFTFLLKAGKDIQKDLFDYDLMMLQISNYEIIRSPKTFKKNFSIKIPFPKKNSDKNA